MFLIIRFSFLFVLLIFITACSSSIIKDFDEDEKINLNEYGVLILDFIIEYPETNEIISCDLIHESGEIKKIEINPNKKNIFYFIVQSGSYQIKNFTNSIEKPIKIIDPRLKENLNHSYNLFPAQINSIGTINLTYRSSSYDYRFDNFSVQDNLPTIKFILNKYPYLKEYDLPIYQFLKPTFIISDKTNNKQPVQNFVFEDLTMGMTLDQLKKQLELKRNSLIELKNENQSVYYTDSSYLVEYFFSQIKGNLYLSKIIRSEPVQSYEALYKELVSKYGKESLKEETLKQWNLKELIITMIQSKKALTIEYHSKNYNY